MSEYLSELENDFLNFLKEHNPGCSYSLRGKVVDLCNKVINTDPEVGFNESYPEGIAFCVFCDAETRLPIFEKVQHKEHCAVLLAKEILKEYE